MYLIGAVAICGLFLLMFGDVSGRFLFNSPIKGTAEVSEYLLVAIAFLSLGYAQLKGIHISVETLVVHFPKKMRTVLNIFFLLVAMTFFIVMTLQIAERAYLDWANKILLSRTTVRLPVWWPSFVAALGCALLVISLGVQIVRQVLTLVPRERDNAEGE
jgi:TRAP-type C4-dicarboxylate transport system permease small subunit